MDRNIRPSKITRPGRLGDEVYQLILGELMSLKIAPGARITVDNLARDLGVSQTPIREALGRLEAEGLVVKTHLVGYSATPQLDRQQFEELYELRLMVEPVSAAHAAERASGDALKKIAALAEDMAAANDGPRDYSRFAQDDDAFHSRILAAAGNNLVRETIGRLHVHLQLFRLLYHPRVTSEALVEHKDIVAALVARDAAEAAAATRRHIERSRARFIGFFEEQRIRLASSRRENVA